MEFVHIKIGASPSSHGTPFGAENNVGANPTAPTISVISVEEARQFRELDGTVRFRHG
jgi:hypothetical protein